MSRNGSGTYTLPAGNPVVTNTTISTTWANSTLTDIATALTGSVASDGQTPMTGPLNLNSNAINNVTDPTLAQDAATKAYVDASIPSTTGFLVKTANLSDVTSASTSRTNLGLGTIATQAASSVAITGGTESGVAITTSTIDSTTIGATTPSTVKATGLTVTGATSGTLAIAATAVAGTNTATFPAATGTVMVTGNMPAFSAYQNSSQSISSATWTKINFQAEEFDTASCFDSTTNMRFTPTVAGYYQVSAAYSSSGGGTDGTIAIYKNASIFKQGALVNSYMIAPTVSALIYFNGSTDYVEAYCYISGSGRTLSATNYQTYFQAAMIRSA
jgi:hypothetical protein